MPASRIVQLILAGPILSGFQATGCSFFDKTHRKSFKRVAKVLNPKFPPSPTPSARLNYRQTGFFAPSCTRYDETSDPANGRSPGPWPIRLK